MASVFNTQTRTSVLQIPDGITSPMFRETLSSLTRACVSLSRDPDSARPATHSCSPSSAPGVSAAQGSTGRGTDTPPGPACRCRNRYTASQYTHRYSRRRPHTQHCHCRCPVCFSVGVTGLRDTLYVTLCALRHKCNCVCPIWLYSRPHLIRIQLIPSHTVGTVTQFLLFVRAETYVPTMI